MTCVHTSHTHTSSSGSTGRTFCSRSNMPLHDDCTPATVADGDTKHVTHTHNMFSLNIFCLRNLWAPERKVWQRLLC